MPPSVEEPTQGTRRAVQALVASLRLEADGPDRASGHSIDIGSPAVYGGHVLAQALMAAARSVDVDHAPHSLHAYFLRAGDKQADIHYETARVRDGASFSTRRVAASQHGQVIFEMSVSFQRHEDGPAHQQAMPDAPAPEALQDDAVVKRAIIDRLPERMQAYLLGDRAIEFRPCDPVDFHAPQIRPPRQLTWLRVADRLPDEPLLHQALLAYASDFSLLSAALLPHGMSFIQPTVQVMSLDHAMWFHRPFRADEWLLYDADSPSAAMARGFCRGSLYRRDGVLVASVAQEGLVRRRSRR
jgi:acyl-CoA thioesterase-2